MNQNIIEIYEFIVKMILINFPYIIYNKKWSKLSTLKSKMCDRLFKEIFKREYFKIWFPKYWKWYYFGQFFKIYVLKIMGCFYFFRNSKLADNIQRYIWDSNFKDLLRQKIQIYILRQEIPKSNKMRIFLSLLRIGLIQREIFRFAQ